VRAAQSAGQILLLGTTISAGLGVVLAYFAGDILQLMGADHAVVARGTHYAAIMLGSNITVFMIFLINAVFHGAGDAVLAMRTLWLANALNIILDPCFIFGWGPFPKMGITSAAVATTIGRGVGVAYQIWHLTARAGRVRVGWADLRPQRKALPTILKTSGNGIAQLLIATTSWVALFVVFARPLVAVFTTGAEVARQAVQTLWVISLAFPLYAAGMCLEATFNGSRDTWTPPRLNFFCFWLG